MEGKVETVIVRNHHAANDSVGRPVSSSQNLASRQRYAKPGGKVDPEQPKSTPQSLMVLYAALAETFSGIQSRRHPNRAKNRTSKASS
ncbi:uncharacterized protein UHOD_11530 [Ustilago sp. UG-2017b]|nr:uncharacterized protein UHOD_11530 [Ustilago sp. UG-2017b]